MAGGCAARRTTVSPVTPQAKRTTGRLLGIMKTLFTAEAISRGGRSGTIQTAGGLLDITLGKSNPQSAIQPVSERFPALDEQEIVFTFSAPEAREVNVAGDFNRWRPEATPLKNTARGNGAVG